MPGHHHPSDDETNQQRAATSQRSELDLMLRAMNHPYRRQTLRYLDQSPEPKPVADIAAAVMNKMDQRSPSDRQQLALELTHRHLPHLTDAELIERTVRDLVAPTEITVDAVQVLDAATKYFD